MRPQIDTVIALLEDGKWHKIDEISQRSRIHEFKIEVLAEFLADYSFLKLDKKEGKARLSKTFVEFLKKARRLQTSMLT